MLALAVGHACGDGGAGGRVCGDDQGRVERGARHRDGRVNDAHTVRALGTGSQAIAADAHDEAASLADGCLAQQLCVADVGVGRQTRLEGDVGAPGHGDDVGRGFGAPAGPRAQLLGGIRGVRDQPDRPICPTRQLRAALTPRTPSPSPTTEVGRQILRDRPESTGSLGCAISEAVESAVQSGGAKRYVLGSVLNQVLLHQSIIGLESKLAMEQLGAGASGKLVAGEDVVEERIHEA